MAFRLKHISGPIPKPGKKKKQARQGNDSKHLNRIKALPCLVCGYVPSQAHHLKQGTNERGMGLKSTDKWAVPLCHEHHINGVETVASTKEHEWFACHGVDNPLEIAKALWEASPDLVKMNLIIKRSLEQRN